MNNVTLSPFSPARLQSLGSILRASVLILLGTAWLALSAQMQIPFWPVKLSMQSFVVLAIGAIYGWKLGSATVLAYLCQGASGLPVFQGGVGLAYIAGPTGGYLLGFVFGAAVMGFLRERGGFQGIASTTMSAILATAAIYIPGLAWLAFLFGYEQAIAFGLTPFIAAEMLKVGLLAALISAVRRFPRN